MTYIKRALGTLDLVVMRHQSHARLLDYEEVETHLIECNETSDPNVRQIIHSSTREFIVRQRTIEGHLLTPTSVFFLQL